jgi:sulfite exporter TauE/SafE
MVWALLPCGLLYSALLVAMFTAGAIQGAMVMAMFALGGALVLTVVPWLWSHWGQRHRTIEWQMNKRVDSKVSLWHAGHLGTRVSGILLVVTAAWGLWTGLTHASSPWCLPSAWV